MADLTIQNNSVSGTENKERDYAESLPALIGQ